MLKTWSLNTKNNLLTITLFLSLPSKRVPISTSLLPCQKPRFFSDITFFCQMLGFTAAFFCHSQISLISLIYISLPNLNFYTIRSMAMFLKVLNKVNFRVFILKPKLFIIDLIQFAKFLVLLAINHSLS